LTCIARERADYRLFLSAVREARANAGLLAQLTGTLAPVSDQAERQIHVVFDTPPDVSYPQLGMETQVTEICN
jgi:hypothetical protein